MTPHRYLYGIGIILGVVAALSAIFRWTEGLSGFVAGENEVVVQVTEAVKVSMPAAVRLKGELHAVNEIDVKAPVTGKVSEIHYKTGDWVRSGAVVATLQSSELTERLRKVEATVESARSEVQQRKAQRSEAENQLQKTQEWHDRNLIPRADLERALAAMETADAQVALAESRLAQQVAMLAQSRQLLSLTRVTAPISGVVTRQVVEPGTSVKGSAAILTIGNADRVKIKLRADTKNFPSVNTGMIAEVHAENDSGISAEGKILRLESHQDGSAASPEVEIGVTSWNRKFLPGAPVIVSIPLPPAKDVALIPSSAIVETADKTYVFKLVDGRGVKIEVIVTERQNGKTTVKGLDENDQIIVAPPAELKPGSRLKISSPALSSLGSEGRILKAKTLQVEHQSAAVGRKKLPTSETDSASY
jgi:RND family efflux transporter MFP subunit